MEKALLSNQAEKRFNQEENDLMYYISFYHSFPKLTIYVQYKEITLKNQNIDRHIGKYKSAMSLESFLAMRKKH